MTALIVDPQHYQRHLERQRAYYKAHSEERREYQKQYNRDHPEVCKNCKHKRRVTEKQGDLTSEDFKAVVSRPCTYCGSTVDIQLDHIVPLSKGGKHTRANVQPLCQRCNLKKYNKAGY